MPMTEQPEKKEIQININPALPTVFVDHLVVAKREDGGVFLRMIAQLPEGWTEQARLMVHEERLKKFVDVICAQLDYYPQKAKPASKIPAKDTK